MSYASTILAEAGLISYYRLNDAATPAVDQKAANNGTIFGTPTLQQAGLINGDADTCMLFNTLSTDNINIKDNNRVIGGLASFSIEAWLKTTDATAAWYVYCERASSAVNDIVRLGTVTAAKSQLTLAYRDTVGTLNNVNSNAGLVMANGVAHHIVCTKSGTAILFYLDGVAVGGGTLTATDTLTSTVNMHCAWGKDYAPDATAGLKATYGDEFALYNVALSGAQVSAHYALGAPPQTSSNAPNRVLARRRH